MKVRKPKETTRNNGSAQIWRNPFINVKNRMTIYNVYVRPVLPYNSLTWVAKSLLMLKLIHTIKTSQNLSR